MSSTAVNVRHKLSVSEYYRMGEAGILHEDDRIELVEGDLIDMAPIGSRHASIVNQLARLLIKAVDDEVIVSVQNPVRLSDWSEPQPDIVVLKPRSDDYFSAHPGPDDVLILIEVADSSIDYDRKTKLPLYARHGVGEVWILDLNAQVLECYTQPSQEGYGQCQRLGSQDQVSPNALPEVRIDLGPLLS